MGPKRGHCRELEAEIVDFIKEEREKCIVVTCEIIQAKARKVARQHGIPHVEFKVSKGWAERFMKRAGFWLRHRTSICQCLPANFKEESISFQHYVIKLHQQHEHMLS